MKGTEWARIAGRLRSEFPKMVLPDDTIEAWFESVHWYPASAVEQAARRMAMMADRVQPTLALLSQHILTVIDENHARAAQSDLQSRWEEPRIPDDLRVRWIKAYAFIKVSPVNHPARVVNRSVNAQRAAGEAVDPYKHLGAIEEASRAQPLSGPLAAAWRGEVAKLLRGGMVAVEGPSS